MSVGPGFVIARKGLLLDRRGIKWWLSWWPTRSTRSWSIPDAVLSQVADQLDRSPHAVDSVAKATPWISPPRVSSSPRPAVTENGSPSTGRTGAANPASGPSSAGQLHAQAADRDGLPVDVLISSSTQLPDPAEAFTRLRWGGQLVMLTPHVRQQQAALRRFADEPGFVVEDQLAVTTPRKSKRFWQSPTMAHHAVVVRKVDLTRPEQLTVRHSYDVKLVSVRQGLDAEYVVLKQVPSIAMTEHRLAQRFPDANAESIKQGARKLVEKVFPLFLTREAAFLRLLQRDMPRSYRDRVPSLLHMEKDERGFVQKMHLNWLRMGGRSLTQLEFAQQASELLCVLHDRVSLVHLDLRLDNMLITRQGVSFVDFGSSVRLDESFERSPMLKTLLNEMLSTSQIQRDMGQLRRSGKLTSAMFIDCHQRVDKAVDLFSLITHMNRTHVHPDLRGLVSIDSHSDEARRMRDLTRVLLQPPDPNVPPLQSARELMFALDRIGQGLSPLPIPSLAG